MEKLSGMTSTSPICQTKGLNSRPPKTHLNRAADSPQCVCVSVRVCPGYELCSQKGPGGLTSLNGKTHKLCLTDLLLCGEATLS